MRFSLITTPWLPVRYRDGSTGKVAPVQITDPSIVDINAPRPDFQGAAWQFLIGLLQTACAPEDKEEWEALWHKGLDHEALQAALMPLDFAFQFGEQTPAFMQDYEALDGEQVGIAALLPEAPGSQALKFNKDHFVKRDTVKAMCPHCAALALFSLQTNAPAGGKGYRTSLRGGGPMTTLLTLASASPATEASLWQKLWLNVIPQEYGFGRPEKITAALFPWLGPTRTSEKASGVTTPEQVDKLQAYWGMPRRIRLNFSDLNRGECSLCGEFSDALLSTMTVKNYGTNYVQWQHPLTPHRRPLKEGGELFSVKGQPGGLFWRDWLGLNWQTASDSNNEYPAFVVKQYHAHPITSVQKAIGLWGFGYDFDNMKARCWYEHRFPLLQLDAAQRERHIECLQQAAKSASRTLNLLRGALKEAWSNDAKNSRGDYSFIDVDFWQLTRPLFDDFRRELAEQVENDALIPCWQAQLWRFARNYFDQHVFTNPYDQVDYAQIMQARKKYFTASAEKQRARTKKSSVKQEANHE